MLIHLSIDKNLYCCNILIFTYIYIIDVQLMQHFIYLDNIYKYIIIYIYIIIYK